ncbi:MAG: YnbE family lipoprotein [Alphaproteobacteria bacterium]|nr:YnbE family lipoprotein [Alphaproteobacteria bacterium]
MRWVVRIVRPTLWFGAGLLLVACSPRVAIEAPSEPITINLNIKIEQEVRIRVERDLDQLFKSEQNIF